MKITSLETGSRPEAWLSVLQARVQVDVSSVAWLVEVIYSVETDNIALSLKVQWLMVVHYNSARQVYWVKKEQGEFMQEVTALETDMATRYQVLDFLIMLLGHWKRFWLQVMIFLIL